MSDDEGPTTDRLEALSKADEQTKTQGENQQQTDASTVESTETTDTEADPTTTPAFPYTQNLGQSIYVRPEVWEKYEEMVDLRLLPELYDLGIKNWEKREVQDAMVRLAINNPDELAKLIAEARGVEQP